jgi:hypothetical protein
VLIWFAVMAVVLTFAVFQSPALDYRMVALGAVLPVIEIPFGAGPLHSLAFPTAVLAVVMLATRNRRLVRRRWLGLPIGIYLHLVLDLAFTRPESFWWPVFGVAGSTGSAFELERGAWSLVMEAVGVVVGVWTYRRFGLDDEARRRRFARSGQLDRELMGPERPSGC